MDETKRPTVADGQIAHLQNLRQSRRDAIKASCPAAIFSRLSKQQQAIVEGYINNAVACYGRRGLSRVVWPWTHRPGVETRAPRGRLSNPTALR